MIPSKRNPQEGTTQAGMPHQREGKHVYMRPFGHAIEHDEETDTQHVHNPIEFDEQREC